MNKEFNRVQPENGENKAKSKNFWKQFGLICLAVGFALITVFIINL